MEQLRRAFGLSKPAAGSTTHAVRFSFEPDSHGNEDGGNDGKCNNHPRGGEDRVPGLEPLIVQAPRCAKVVEASTRAAGSARPPLFRSDALLPAKPAPDAQYMEPRARARQPAGSSPTRSGAPAPRHPHPRGSEHRACAPLVWGPWRTGRCPQLRTAGVCKVASVGAARSGPCRARDAGKGGGTRAPGSGICAVPQRALCRTAPGQ